MYSFGCWFSAVGGGGGRGESDCVWAGFADWVLFLVLGRDPTAGEQSRGCPGPIGGDTQDLLSGVRCDEGAGREGGRGVGVGWEAMEAYRRDGAYMRLCWRVREAGLTGMQCCGLGGWWYWTAILRGVSRPLRFRAEVEFSITIAPPLLVYYLYLCMPSYNAASGLYARAEHPS